MLKHVALLPLLLALLPQDSVSFFWKNRFIYSTLDPQPTWPSEMLREFDEHRQYWKDASEGKISDPYNTWTESASQILYQLQCREEYVQEATEYSVYKERLLEYVENVFRQIFNIWGHKYQKHRLQFVNIKDWITSKFFLRDPKAKLNMMNNVNINWFHIRRQNEYINERWKGLWKDIKFYKSMIDRMSKVYFNYHYPDGVFKTRLNDWLGIKNELREKALAQRTTAKTRPTTTRIFDDEFFRNYYLKDQSDKKKKKK